MSNKHAFSLTLALLLYVATNFIVSGVIASPKEKIVSQNDCIATTKDSKSKRPQEIEIMDGMLKVVNGNFLVFERGDMRVEAAVTQPDYGRVTALRVTSNGDVYAIGVQRSYRVVLAPTVDGANLEINSLPVLYQQLCDWFGTLFGTCMEQRAIYSDAVSAVFLSGYDARGVLKSYVYGLTDEVLDLSAAPSPHYQRDCDMGFVVMVGKSSASIMDKSGDIQPYDTK